MEKHSSPAETLSRLDLEDPSRPGLVQALEEAHRAFKSALESAEPGQIFHRPAPDRWSVDEQARHLITSVNAMAKGLTLPKLLIRLRFGRASRSRSYREVVAFYRSQLANGARASGRFVPAPRTGASGARGALEVGDASKAGDGGSDAQHQNLVKRWRRANDRLVDGLNGWNEKQLDRLRLPHPVLGPMTVREMLFFTYYHNLHHAQSVREVTAALGGPRG